MLGYHPSSGQGGALGLALARCGKKLAEVGPTLMILYQQGNCWPALYRHCAATDEVNARSGCGLVGLNHAVDRVSIHQPEVGNPRGYRRTYQLFWL